jgi:hypothetical protein
MRSLTRDFSRPALLHLNISAIVFLHANPISACGPGGARLPRARPVANTHAFTFALAYSIRSDSNPLAYTYAHSNPNAIIPAYS